MRRNTRPKVVWKDKAPPQDPDFLRPPPHQKEYALYDTSMEEYLVPGALFKIQVPMMPLNMLEGPPRRYKQHTYKYLIETYYDSNVDSRIFNTGTIAVYAGTVREIGRAHV